MTSRDDSEALQRMKPPGRWLGFGAAAAFLALLIGGLLGTLFAAVGFLGIWLAARAGVRDRVLTICAAVVFLVSAAGGFVASAEVMKAQLRAQERQQDQELERIADEAVRNMDQDHALEKILEGASADGGQR